MAAPQLLPMNPLHTGGAFRDLDECVICQECLPEAIFSCGHTVYCLGCYDAVSLRSRNGRLRCPMCRAECGLETITNRRQLQIGTTSLSELDEGSELPFRPLLDFGVIPDDFEMNEVAFKRYVDRIKMFMRDIGEGRLNADTLLPAMHQQLTGYQQELVWIELAKDADLHSVILKVDQKILQQHDSSAHFRSILKHVIEKDDQKALRGRAIIGTAAVVADIAIEGLGSGLRNFGTADVISSVAILALFSAVEIGRCIADPTYTLKALSINIGEHACGCTVGAVGAWAGFVGVTTLLGTGPLGVILGIISMFGASFACDLTVRTKYRTYAKDWTTAEVETEKRSFVERTAASMGIDIKTHNFAAAKKIYREGLLKIHPDRAVDPEVKKTNGEATVEFIAGWQIVRAYYKDVLKDSGLCCTGGAEVQDAKEPEGFVEVFKMKIQKPGQETWTTVRTWFSPRRNAEVGTKEITKEDGTFDGMECVEKFHIYF